MGVRGIARDLAAAGLGTFKPLAVPQVEGSFPCPVDVRIEDAEGCPAFYGQAIRGVRNGASPEWMQRRLKSAGQRPISALVDITNYVMLDHGRPGHAYDIAKIGGALIARRAREGERVVALNGKEYELPSEVTVIADEAQVHDIGGIMGGEHSGVTEATTDVMLEVAYFSPERIGRSGQLLGLTSDARSRFERGADPAFLDNGLAILTGLILDICGGEASEAVRAGEPPVAAKRVRFDSKRTRALGGVDVPEERQHAILSSLGFVVENGEAVVPSWRPDVDGPADLVEEITRIHGFEHVPSTPLEREPGVAHPTATRSQLLERRVRRTAAARGLDEAVTWSFISEAEAEAFGGGDWKLMNPISEEMKVMRPSLLPSLVAAARRNLDRGQASVRLFEIGRRYLGDAEHPTVGLLLAGDKGPRHWESAGVQGFSPFDAKGEVLALLEAAGAPVANLQTFPDAGPTWHPGRSATLRLGPKTVLAAFGELHPALVRKIDGPAGAMAAEIYLDAIPPARSAGRARPAFAPPALQPVFRDFAFLVPDDLTAEALVRSVRGADKAAITDVRLFDRFETADGLSLALEVTLQPADKSFTDEEIAAISKRVVAAAEKLGARLRA
jgi:phenylalanyl-tRNA synthetase beta chain